MRFKIFMASAASMYERDILRAYAAGIEQWARTNSETDTAAQDAVMIGRWQQVETTRHYVEYEYDENYSACDVAVIFGSWKQREKGSHVTRGSVASQAKFFVVIETPLLGRHTDQENQYWRTGINGFLNQAAHWPEMPTEIADQRMQALGAQWPGWQNNPDGHVLIALQLPGDASLRGADINDWCYRTITKIRCHTMRPIVVRNHPLASDRAFEEHAALAHRLLLDGVTNIRFSDGKIVPWSDDLQDAYCTVTYTSGLAIDSVMQGIPTLACDAGNFAWPFSSHDVDQIENLQRADSMVIHEWLRRLVACQYTTTEMSDGTAWNYTWHVLERLMQR